MHPSEKTLRIYKEDNDTLRIKLDQLSERVLSMKEQHQADQAAIALLTKQNNQLAKELIALRQKSKLPPKRSVEASPERVLLFTEIEQFIRNYDGPRPRPYQLSSSPVAHSYIVKNRQLGSYVPANILYDYFLHQSEWEIPPTFHLFCRQLNLLNLHKIRCRIPGTEVRPGPQSANRSRPAPSQLLAKSYVYLIPYPSHSPLSDSTS